MEFDFYTNPRPFREIRAVFDQEAVRVYQAFRREIALPALERQTFVPPFRFERITSWIKPSFLWTMKRTDWGRYCRIGKGGRPEHEGDTVVLGIDVERAFFDDILSRAQITHFEEQPEQDRALWRSTLARTRVLIQWDPEKTLEGGRRRFKAIQIGLKSPALKEYAHSILKIRDMADVIAAVAAAPSDAEKVALLPPEKPYPVSPETRSRLNMSEKPTAKARIQPQGFANGRNLNSQTGEETCS